MDSLGYLIMRSIFDQLGEYQASMIGPFLASFRGFVRTFVTLYVVIVGYQVLMGKVGDKAKNWTISIFLVITLQGMLLESNAYNEWVFQPLMGTALSMASFFAGTEAGDEFGLFGKLDQAIGSIVSTVDRLDPGGNIITNSMAYMKVGAASFILLLFVTALYMVYLALSLLALFSMYVLLLIGGPFLLFAAFDETRFIAKTWLKTFLQYALWLAMLALVMAIAIPGVLKAADGLANWDVVRDGVFTKQYGMTLLFCGVVIYFLLKVSDLSAALTGGMGMQSSIAGGMIGGGIGALGSAANVGGRGAMGAAAAGAGNLASMGAYAAGRGAGAAAGAAIRGFSALKGLTQ